VIRPDNDEALPCVYYIHGGGMGFLSCFDGIFRGWGKLIAANGVAVVMVDFRNAVVPSTAAEVAPFPAGLNDCVSGLKWVIAWPSPDCPSSTENNGIFIHVQTNRATVGYGIGAFVDRNPLAWPSFATAADVEGFPPVETFTTVCPEISRDTARDLAAFCQYS
jgi:acetyl esterase